MSKNSTSKFNQHFFYPNTAHLSSRLRRTLQKTFETSTSATVKACQKISLSSAKFKFTFSSVHFFPFDWLLPPPPGCRRTSTWRWRRWWQHHTSCTHRCSSSIHRRTLLRGSRWRTSTLTVAALSTLFVSVWCLILSADLLLCFLTIICFFFFLSLSSPRLVLLPMCLYFPSLQQEQKLLIQKCQILICVSSALVAKGSHRRVFSCHWSNCKAGQANEIYDWAWSNW